MELIVNGVEDSVARSGGGSFGLERRADLPEGETGFHFRRYSDDEELLSDETKRVRIVGRVEGWNTEYRVEPVGQPETVA